MSDYIEHERGGPDVRAISGAGASGTSGLAPESTSDGERGKQLAAIALAAVAPKLIKSTLRFITRHPMLTVAGLAGYSVAMMQSHRTRNAAA